MLPSNPGFHWLFSIGWEDKTLSPTPLWHLTWVSHGWHGWLSILGFTQPIPSPHVSASGVSLDSTSWPFHITALIWRLSVLSKAEKSSRQGLHEMVELTLLFNSAFHTMNCHSTPSLLVTTKTNNRHAFFRLQETFYRIYLFRLSWVACGILVPQAGIEPGPSAVKT